LLINQVTNVETVELACGDHEGEIEFFVANDHHCSSLIESWPISPDVPSRKVIVRTTTLDAFFDDSSRQGPDFIKMDIEGGAVFALKGCDRCTEKFRPLFWIESHTPTEDKAIGEFTLRHGYSAYAYRLQHRGWVKNLNSTYPDPEGVWGTLLLCPPELSEKMKDALA
jgi:FkbM family methyltransferase